MAKRDSSLNRVKPIFNALRRKDPSGASWLQPLLKMVKRDGHPQPLPIPADLGDLTYYESAYPLDTPQSYLKWLITNPDKLIRPPRTMWSKWIEHTQKMREDLLAGVKEAQTEAILCLENWYGIHQSKWWCLEGVTYVDYALFTNSISIFIEGKWTGVGTSKKMLWNDKRNQALRVLDCAANHVKQNGESHYFVIMVVERDLVQQDPVIRREIEDVMSPETVKSSLPHLTVEERNEVLSHYLGTISWEELVEHFELEKEVIPLEEKYKDDPVPIPVLQKQFETIQEDIRTARVRKVWKIRKETNLSIKDIILEAVSADFPNYRISVVSDVVDLDNQKKSYTELIFNDKHGVRIPLEASGQVDIADIRFCLLYDEHFTSSWDKVMERLYGEEELKRWYYGIEGLRRYYEIEEIMKKYYAREEPRKRYNEIEELRTFGEDVLKHIEVFRLIIGKIKEHYDIYTNTIAMVEQEIITKEVELMELESRLKQIRINTLLKGNRLCFDEEYGKQIYTDRKRGQYYRWIEITNISPTRRTVDIRGLIKEKVIGDRRYHGCTGKDVIFERKRVRVSTLLSSLGERLMIHHGMG